MSRDVKQKSVNFATSLDVKATILHLSAGYVITSPKKLITKNEQIIS